MNMATAVITTKNELIPMASFMVIASGTQGAHTFSMMFIFHKYTGLHAANCMHGHQQYRYNKDQNFNCQKSGHNMSFR